MKILHLGKYYPPFFGGIENFMAELMAQQARDGHDVAAIVHHHQTAQPFAFEQDTAHHLEIYRVPIYGQVAYAPLSPGFGYYLQRLMKKQRPEVLHIHLPNLSAFWCLFSARARKIPWVVHWHADVLGSVPDVKIKLLYPFYRLFESALLRRATKIIATSGVYFDSSEPLRRFADKVSVIPLGLADLPPTSAVQPTEQAAKQATELQLLMIGRLTYYKGHGVLLEAVAQLQRQNITVSLTIIGSGELAEKLSAQIAALGLGAQVEMRSKVSVDELNRAMLHCDLLCLPSIERTEAFGVVLMEAMRVAKPCLVTDVPGSGMSWVVQDGQTGFVVAHNNARALAEKLAALSADPTALVKLGQAGRQRFLAMFSIAAVSKKIDRLYRLNSYENI